MSNEKEPSERYVRGRARLGELDELQPGRVAESLKDAAPDLARYAMEFPYGDIYSRPGLDLKQREIAAVAMLSAMGGAEPQLKFHISAAMNVGLSREEVTEVVMQTVVYAGFPRALNAMNMLIEVLAERDGEK
ncbi:MAG TPA: carboxymuconolactone decarboxylase family protein [Sneathiellales bacterium]|nr:carboxymuconolactone decarboxylase family protein [Sneathiellales bacterium]